MDKSRHAFLASSGLTGDHHVGFAASHAGGVSIKGDGIGIGKGWPLATAHRFNNAGQTKFPVCIAEFDTQWLAEGSRNEMEWSVAENHDGIFCFPIFTFGCVAGCVGLLRGRR